MMENIVFMHHRKIFVKVTRCLQMMCTPTSSHHLFHLECRKNNLVELGPVGNQNYQRKNINEKTCKKINKCKKKLKHFCQSILQKKQGEINILNSIYL